MRKKKTDNNSVMLSPAYGSVSGIKNEIAKSLKKYDSAIGLAGEDSLETLWERAWEVRDVNDIVGANLRHIQVMIADVFRTLIESKSDGIKVLEEARLNLGQIDDVEKKAKMIQSLLALENSNEKNQIEQVKLVNALVKTSRELANEIRQSAMARRFNIHVSEVKKMAIAFRAVLHEEIQDVNLLCRISEKLDNVMKKLFPIKAEGDY
jgi:type I site-specific restriction endonuclease